MPTRLLYFAMAHLHLDMMKVGLLRYGTLLDLYECYLQATDSAKPHEENYIDDLIPFGFG